MDEKDLDFYCDGVRSGDRRILAKAITLIESAHPVAPWSGAQRGGPAAP
jgi:putative protein kinase ArgK-like GTPase of G3E family